MEKYEGLTDLQTKLNEYFKIHGDLINYEVSTNENTSADGVSHELNINVVIEDSIKINRNIPETRGL